MSCANCKHCSPSGFCSQEDAVLSVNEDYPVQSDFCCRYWEGR